MKNSDAFVFSWSKGWSKNEVKYLRDLENWYEMSKDFLFSRWNAFFRGHLKTLLHLSFCLLYFLLIVDVFAIGIIKSNLLLFLNCCLLLMSYMLFLVCRCCCLWPSWIKHLFIWYLLSYLLLLLLHLKAELIF